MSIRVDFYLLGEPTAQAAQRTVGRLIETIWSKGNQVYLYTASPGETQVWDRVLWSYRQEGFLPHAPYRSGPAPAGERVLVGDSVPPEDWGGVLVNLVGEVPAFYNRFSRVAELVTASPEVRNAGRERYRYYREQGHELHLHEL